MGGGPWLFGRCRGGSLADVSGACDAAAPPEVITAQEVGKMLGIDQKTVYVGAKRGEIPHRRVGRRFIFCRQAIEAWLLGQEDAGGRMTSDRSATIERCNPFTAQEQSKWQ